MRNYRKKEVVKGLSARGGTRSTAPARPPVTISKKGKEARQVTRNLSPAAARTFQKNSSRKSAKPAPIATGAPARKYRTGVQGTGVQYGRPPGTLADLAELGRQIAEPGSALRWPDRRLPSEGDLAELRRRPQGAPPPTAAPPRHPLGSAQELAELGRQIRAASRPELPGGPADLAALERTIDRRRAAKLPPLAPLAGDDPAAVGWALLADLIDQAADACDRDRWLTARKALDAAAHQLAGANLAAMRLFDACPNDLGRHVLPARRHLARAAFFLSTAAAAAAERLLNTKAVGPDRAVPEVKS